MNIKFFLKSELGEKTQVEVRTSFHGGGNERSRGGSRTFQNTALERNR